MSAIPREVTEAVETLVQRMDAGDYNPTPIIELGALIASADGVVDADEIDTLRRILQPMLGAELPADVVKFLIESSGHAIEAAGVDARIRVVAEVLTDCDAVEPAMIVALGVAFASVGFTAAEQAIIEKLAAETDFPRDKLAKLIERMRGQYRDIEPQSARRRSTESPGPRD
ncbi:MAG: TerB family tellurite resistance protein [Deltaproteobacteria bacterium]|nr:TerB family tellurite resistance protein [Deltaproteobacteria bacterium]